MNNIPPGSSTTNEVTIGEVNGDKIKICHNAVVSIEHKGRVIVASPEIWHKMYDLVDIIVELTDNDSFLNEVKELRNKKTILPRD